MESSADKWQQYKEWLIEQTAASGHPVDEETLQRMYEEPAFPSFLESPIEARLWMQNPIAHGLLAVNRFDNRANGFAFVENLYALGAEAVYVTNIDFRATNFDLGGLHADTLIVTMSQDPERRRALLNIYEAENYDAPGEPVADEGQEYIGFWWD